MRLAHLALPALLTVSTAAAAAPLQAPLLRADTVRFFRHTADTVIIAPQAPPPVPAETIPPAPSSEVVWHPGHWAWNGTQYIWVAGQYVERPRPQVAWLPGHWDRAPDGWIWVDGHWQ